MINFSICFSDIFKISIFSFIRSRDIKFMPYNIISANYLYYCSIFRKSIY
ncbi:Uncharacterised protein [Neisseria gonorrhoeae]|uniref:Uncharacterized protein n=1 Tax=Neisseria gonorrhoeae TaxID=485 RepID=A0AB74EDC1_NEIGO|nr:hypothetical protein NGFG_02347 [Neisseria gonorrhoeae MS11]EJU74136.1 hypothetical protein NMEN2795_2067 [Neisseria meningitidis NM2795]ELK94245.1 hypothetical protein NM9757_2066 [Neisseria meningitidis 9757]EQD02905.1 hypothetical protein NM045_2174 [Neisseria meningitidis NM045]EQD18513.1 hypothetical protein NM2866_2181 [Neisseria meningitidis NM2866]QBK54333.1 hypothetical protein TFGB2_01133 [Neisseria gonorrhoeae]CWO89523.1 Uncharacterised protein [Neisseria meningitidis]